MKKKAALVSFAGLVLLALNILSYFWLLNSYIYNEKQSDSENQTDIINNDSGGSSTDNNLTGDPDLTFADVITGLDHPWDVVFPSENVIFYSLRGGDLRGHNPSTDDDWLLVRPQGVDASGEGGLLGIEMDSDFSNNRYLYACYNYYGSDHRDIHVTRYKVSEDLKAITETNNIITGIESQGGRHSGCRIASAKNGHLWIGTGDSALGEAPQNPKSLAGKVLRVARDGQAVAGNLSDPFDTRIFSYGHRNVQGIVLVDGLTNGAFGYTVEQGTDKNDELNYLLPGNFGYDPEDDGSYSETSPMTDTDKFPDAVPHVYATGDSTLALSGVEVLTDKDWRDWRGRILIAALKAERGVLVNPKSPTEPKMLFTGQYGRIRTFSEAPDGSLYILTDNGGNKDKIIRAVPR